MSIVRRLTALEQNRPLPQPKRRPEDIEALIQWYAEQFNFAKAVGIAGISEEEALERWGDDYRLLTQKVDRQQQECLTYCQAQNARLPQAATQKEKEEELPSELQDAPPELRYDRRRQRDLQKRRRQCGSNHKTGTR